MFEYIFIFAVKDDILYADFVRIYTYIFAFHTILSSLKWQSWFESECWIDNFKIIHKIFLHSRWSVLETIGKGTTARLMWGIEWHKQTDLCNMGMNLYNTVGCNLLPMPCKFVFCNKGPHTIPISVPIYWNLKLERSEIQQVQCNSIFLN